MNKKKVHHNLVDFMNRPAMEMVLLTRLSILLTFNFPHPARTTTRAR